MQNTKKLSLNKQTLWLLNAPDAHGVKNPEDAFTGGVCRSYIGC